MRNVREPEQSLHAAVNVLLTVVAAEELQDRHRQFGGHIIKHLCQTNKITKSQQNVAHTQQDDLRAPLFPSNNESSAINARARPCRVFSADL